MEPLFADYAERFSTLLKDFAAAVTGLAQDSLDFVPGVDMNSLTVLVAHTTGSARFWVGDLVFDEPSNRNRAAEFETRGLSEAELLAMLNELDGYIREGVAKLTLADLNKQVTNPFSGEQITAGWSLLHALEHTALHLGHAQITRQLWDQSH